MKCKALIVNCMDPRLQGENLLKIAGVAGLSSGEYEVLAYPGPSLWMTDPQVPADSKTFWWILDNVSTSLHGISKIVLVGHSNCGGFALKGAPKEPNAEREAIVESLSSAAQLVSGKYPQLEVVPLFVKIGQASDSGALPEIEVEPVEVVAAVGV